VAVKAWLKLALAGVAAVVVGQLLVQRSGRLPAPGTTPPSFTLRATDGTEVALASLRGRVVAVNFWATWCQPCLRELPELSAARQADRGRCLEVVGVAEESASDDVAAAARQLPYPVVLDPGAGVAAAWGVTGYPRTFLLDREGRLARVFEGALDRRTLEEAVAPLLDPACRTVPP
jgi:cytochrome c biogenesis protein CcmG, thiol:disulfide interchange protein DsbE